jgi:predicted HTH domain antitoxin
MASKRGYIKESKKLLALKCYRDKILSLGKSAESAGFPLWDFIEFLGENNVDVIACSEEQLEREFKTVEKLRKVVKH